MRNGLILGLMIVTLPVTHATTLQQLTLDDMTQKSTTIVRGSVRMTQGEIRGGSIYTHYTVQVVEQMKGIPASLIDFVVPGGTVNGLHQTIAGAPALVNGQEYLLFLWTSRGGLTTVIGLTQGVFISANGLVTRPAMTTSMIGSTGAVVSDPGMQMTLPDMRSRVKSALSEGPAH